VKGEPVDWRTAPDAPFTTDSVAAGITAPAGRITGSGDALALDPAQNNAFRLLNRALAAGGTVRYAPARGEAGARYLVSGVARDRLDGWARELGLRAERRDGAAGSAAVRARVAVYRPWTGSMDEGWLEWLLDRHELPYTVLTNADVQAGDLGARFDVVFLASDSPRTITAGYAAGTVPPRYAGGLDDAGARALDAFVRAGGTLVALNRSADYAIDALHLPVRNVVGELPRKDFFTGGSLLAVTTDPAHPVMAGMPTSATVFVDDSPVFTTLDGFEGAALATYAPVGSPLRSGYLLGETHLQGHAAALDVRHGDGHVVLVGFRPQWRGQPFGTFRVVFNAALFGGEAAARARGTPDFWSPPALSEPADSAPPRRPGGAATGEDPAETPRTD
jgi:hypothetical protein